MGRLRWALADLTRADSVAELTRLGVESTCSLGFHRAVVSCIDGDRWMVERVYVGSSDGPPGHVANGARDVAPLGEGAPEAELRKHQEPIVVRRLSRRPPSPVHVTPVAPYVAAAIVLSGGTVGFLHADRGGDAVDEEDAELLGLVASAYSLTLQHLILSDEFHQLRANVAKACGELVSFAVDPSAGVIANVSSTFDALGEAAQVRPVPRARDGLERALTDREGEVVALMARGATNVRIARALVISEATAKSHVRNIMRKLGAANRAEAVSLWHQSSQRL